MQNVKRPTGQLLMINLGLIFAIFQLLFFPINIYLTLRLGSGYHNYNDYGLIGNVIHFSYPLISLFEVKILGQISKGQFLRGLRNLKIWFWINFLLIFVPLLESFLLDLEIDYYDVLEILPILFVFHYWKKPSHQEFFNNLNRN